MRFAICGTAMACGRGVIQTTGRCNFGTLNHFLGKSHLDPGEFPPPASVPYPEVDFCKDPEVICASEEHRELKWIAGLFYWMSSVQEYDEEGWDFEAELAAPERKQHREIQEKLAALYQENRLAAAAARNSAGDGGGNTDGGAASGWRPLLRSGERCTGPVVDVCRVLLLHGVGDLCD